MLSRRRALEGAFFSAATAALGGRAMADPLAPRALSMLNLHTGERLKAVYWDAGGYVQDALRGFDKLLRDHRTTEVHPIDPGVFDILNALQVRLGVEPTVQIISGYRSPATNAALHDKSAGVATGSLHMQGKALDIRVPGVKLANLRDAAWALQKGGVGFYPGSDFVHVDVGRVRRW